MFYYKITFTHLLGISETVYVSMLEKLTREIITNFLGDFVSFTVETLDIT